jgi:hypothetical protein
MAAYIVIPRTEHWPVIERFLGDCEQGAIVIPPDVAQKLRSQGLDVGSLNGELIDYDFGGEADKLIDVLGNTDHYALDAVREHLGTTQDEDT